MCAFLCYALTVLAKNSAWTEQVSAKSDAFLARLWGKRQVLLRMSKIESK